MIEPPLRVEPLGPQHDRAAFSCGEPSLDDYLRRFAGQDERLDLTRCFVLVHEKAPARILGYYTLSTASIVPEKAPGKVGKVKRYREIGALLLGRLAIDRREQGKGLGRKLLLHVLIHVARLGKEAGFALILVDPLNEKAATFYRTFGFAPLPGERRMYLMLKDIRTTLKALGGDRFDPFSPPSSSGAS